MIVAYTMRVQANSSHLLLDVSLQPFLGEARTSNYKASNLCIPFHASVAENRNMNIIYYQILFMLCWLAEDSPSATTTLHIAQIAKHFKRYYW